MVPSLQRIVIVAFIGTVMVAGCIVATEKDVVHPLIKTTYEGEYQVSEYLKDHQPRTVAILPFNNETKKEETFEIVRETFYNNFSSLRYGDVELFKVDQRLQKAGLKYPAEVNSL